MADIPFDLPDFDAGSVWLIGAGPGDPGLLTLLALHGIRSADTLVYDALVDRRIVQAAPPGADIIFAGKRGGRPSQKQPDISGRLIELAREGRRVARLKGGDPFVFGRGGEEAQALHAAGIPFRVVPGVTAATGGLAYAGIPLTHRDTNSSVAFLTGHGAGGTAPEGFDWAALVRGVETLVVYMPLGHLQDICRDLVSAGRGADTEAALVAHATTDRQLVVETTLGALADVGAPPGIDSPALLVVGRNVALRRDIAWFEPRAAKGRGGQSRPR